MSAITLLPKDNPVVCTRCTRVLTAAPLPRLVLVQWPNSDGSDSRLFIFCPQCAKGEGL